MLTFAILLPENIRSDYLIHICAPLHPAADSIVVEINPTSYASRLVASSYM